MKPTVLGLTLALTAAACTGNAASPGPETADAAAVVNVLDGDSLLVEVGGVEVEVRLLGINTPERDECFDTQAKARTTELASAALQLSGSDVDRFGRLLAYAYASDGTLINQQLVAEGLALALSSSHPLLDDFKAAESGAFQERLGRWQPDACGPATADIVEISELEYDAPGDDARNTNGEWVEITNAGTPAWLSPAGYCGTSPRPTVSGSRTDRPWPPGLPPGSSAAVGRTRQPACTGVTATQCGATEETLPICSMRRGTS